MTSRRGILPDMDKVDSIRITRLLAERNVIDQEIAKIMHWPMTFSHLGF